MENLKTLRIKNNITQKEVAETIGVSQPAYACYENGRREPDNKTLLKLAAIFNVSTDYLLGREEQSKITYNKQKEITFDETRLLDHYRTCPDVIRSDISKLLCDIASVLRSSEGDPLSVDSTLSKIEETMLGQTPDYENTLPESKNNVRY